MAIPAPVPAPDQPFAVPLLQVRPWSDPVIDQLGHDLRSDYVERFWLGILGPSTTLLLRRLAAGLDQAPDGFEIDLADTAGALGLAARGGRNSPFMRALTRSTKFGLTRLHRDQLDVRRHVPPLTLAHLARLPERLQAQHHEWMATERGPMSPSDQQRRARRLALGLLETGESVQSVENQLHRLRFHPAMAHEAVRWALSRHLDDEADEADEADEMGPTAA